MLLAHLVNDGAFVERFQREAAAVARLRHTNIVQVHDFGIYDDIPYMVMEFIPGVTLKDRLTALRMKGDRMAVKDVLAFTWELSSALDHAHAHGLVHRDVKPANILLREAAPTHCEAILTDFGIAKILEGVQFTETGLSMGTPDYMSPEQAAGDAITPQTDVYALGIVVFEMLTGQTALSRRYTGGGFVEAPQHRSALPPHDRSQRARGVGCGAIPRAGEAWARSLAQRR